MYVCIYYVVFLAVSGWKLGLVSLSFGLSLK